MMSGDRVLLCFHIYVYAYMFTPTRAHEVEKMSYMKERESKKESLGNGVRSQDSSELFVGRNQIFLIFTS
jgi:hypothetical protein